MAIIFSIWPGWTGLLALPGLVLLCLNGIWVGLLLGIISARFRDVPPIVASVVRILFFVTPIIWMPELMPGPCTGAGLQPALPFRGVGAGAIAGAGSGIRVMARGFGHHARRMARGVRAATPLPLADRLLGMNAVVSLRLQSVTVDFPVYNAGARSLKNRLLHHGTGGASGVVPATVSACVPLRMSAWCSSTAIESDSSATMGPEKRLCFECTRGLTSRRVDMCGGTAEPLRC